MTNLFTLVIPVLRLGLLVGEEVLAACLPSRRPHGGDMADIENEFRLCRRVLCPKPAVSFVLSGYPEGHNAFLGALGDEEID